MAKQQKKQAREAAIESWKIQNLLTMLRWGLTRDPAIVKAELSRASVYLWMKDNEDFKTQIEDAEEAWLSVVESAKNQKITEWYRPAIEKELKSRKRDIYGDKSEVDQTTKHTGDVIIKLPKVE